MKQHHPESASHSTRYLFAVALFSSPYTSPRGAVRLFTEGAFGMASGPGKESFRC